MLNICQLATKAGILPSRLLYILEKTRFIFLKHKDYCLTEKGKHYGMFANGQIVWDETILDHPHVVIHL